MSRRLLLATGSGEAIAPPPDPDPDPVLVEPTLPYAFPTSAPWNVPIYTVTPTPDGTGSVIHPGVLDFGGTPWNGFRFWMAATPLYGGVEDLENPCIYASHDGFNWSAPPGLTNPIYDDPPDIGGKVYNSDTDLVYDAANNRVVVFWREVDEGLPKETIWRMTSTDGSTWTDRQVAITQGTKIGLVSPAVTAYGSGYAMWVIEHGTFAVRFADTLTSTFPQPQTSCSWIGAAPTSAWHVAVIKHGSTWKGLLLDTGQPGYRLYPITSVNGIAWKLGEVVMLPVTGEVDWQFQEVYRSSLQPHQDGLHMRVWYSGTDTGLLSWRVGYTRIPLTAWPTM